MLKCSPGWGNFCTNLCNQSITIEWNLYMIRAYVLYLRRLCCHPRCRGLSTRQPSAPLVPTRPQWRRPVHFDVANQLPMPLCACVESKWLSWYSVLSKHLNSPAIGIRDDNGADGGGLLIPALYRYLTSSEWLEYIIPLRHELSPWRPRGDPRRWGLSIWQPSAPLVAAGRRGGGFYIFSSCQTNHRFYWIL